MAHERFDDLARALAGGTSRRKLFRLLGAGVGATALGAVATGRQQAGAGIVMTREACFERCENTPSTSAGRQRGQCFASCARLFAGSPGGR